MQMMYNRNGTLIEYTLKTDPPEAMYWTTYRLKKGDIQILTKTDRQTDAAIRQEIFDDIISREPNIKTTKDKVPKKRKSTAQKHVKGGQSKRKTRQHSNN